MNRQMAKKALAAAVLAAAFGGSGARAAEPQAAYAVNQAIELKEAGKPARRCTIVAVAKLADGTFTYTVKANDTGEAITVYSKATAAGKPAPEMKPVAAARPVSPYGMAVKVDATPIDRTGAPPLAEPKKLEAQLTAAPKPSPYDSDPLLQVPDDTRGAKTPPAPIIANVNEAVSSPSSAEPAPAKESHGLFGWVFGTRAPAKPTAAPATSTVSSAMNAKPVVLEGDSLAPAAPPKGMTATAVSMTKPTSAAGFAMVGEPAMAAPVPMSAIAVPALPMVPQPSVPTAYAAPPADVRLQLVLKQALQPSEREMAVLQLGASGSAASPAVKASLMTAAKDDPAPSVRASCLRCLAKVAPGDPSVARVLEAAKDDRDARVRNEANELLGAGKK